MAVASEQMGKQGCSAGRRGDPAYSTEAKSFGPDAPGFSASGYRAYPKVTAPR